MTGSSPPKGSACSGLRQEMDLTQTSVSKAGLAKLFDSLMSHLRGEKLYYGKTLCRKNENEQKKHQSLKSHNINLFIKIPLKIQKKKWMKRNIFLLLAGI